MCLAVLSLGQHPRFPLVLVANRDEFFDRPALALDWWQAPGHVQPILAGRDLSAGGTWLGLSTQGRLALLTNVRAPGKQRPDAPSRGSIVPDWLSGTDTLLQANQRWQQAGHNGFNLITADLCAGQWAWTATQQSQPLPLAPGLHGLSNASLDTPWPKVLRLRQAVQQALQAPLGVGHLAHTLFEALADPATALDVDLPSTGLPMNLERALSAVFIRSDDGRYGTRCSTVLLQERDTAGQCTTYVFERSFGPQPGQGELAWTSLRPWPCLENRGPGAPSAITPVERVAQRAPGYGTTLPSTLRKVDES